MGFEAILGPAVSLLGGAISADSASDTAAGQDAATNRATDLQKYVYDNNVRLNQPAIDAGNLSRNKLMELLGLGGTPGGTPSSQGTSSSLTKEQLRAQLLPQFTKAATPGGYYPPENLTYGPEGNNQDQIWRNGTPSSVDENGLMAAINQQYNSYSGSSLPGIDSNSADYGSLNKQFTGADLASEPGYQFGLAEGYKGLDRRAAAGGGYFSGMALKAAQRFGQDYAGTKFNEAFNRDTTNKTNLYNRYMGIVSPGQTAANQVQSAGTNYANATGDLVTGNANAQGAAGIASGNAWNKAIGGAANAYTDWNAQNSLMKNIQWPSDMGQSWSYDK